MTPSKMALLKQDRADLAEARDKIEAAIQDLDEQIQEEELRAMERLFKVAPKEAADGR